MRGKLFTGFRWLVIALAAIFAAPQARTAEYMTYGETLCNNPGYHCITAGTTVVEKKVKTRKGERVYSKKVRDTWETLWPDAGEREIVMKVNRMNVRLKPGMIIAVPDDMAGKTLMDFSPFAKRFEPECVLKGEAQCRLVCQDCGNAPVVKQVCEQECEPKDKLAFGPDGELVREKTIIFDPNLVAYAAYDEKGDLTRWGPAAGGKDWCADIRKPCFTESGDFKVQRKAGRWATSSQFPIARAGKKAGGAPIPYFMSFSRGMGIHGSPEVPGRNASHGCVRVFYEDAVWLNQEFTEIGTRVIVKPYE